MKKAVLLMILSALMVVPNFALAQAPKENNLINPIDIPLVLSGTFGELRGNHFHTGLDIKTQGRTGISVKSIEDGYVSRINVSTSGYGNAIYVVHPSGITSVYAHLKEFSPEIEKYVLEQHYKLKKFELKLFPNKDKFIIKQGEVIAKTGNSGGSGGPHLHFEIRDTKTQRPQNPLLYKYKIKDTKAPLVRGVYIYSVDKNSAKENSINKINLVVDNHNFKSKSKIEAFGWVGFGVNSVDKLNAANNKNGVYSISLYVNNKIHFEFKMDELIFNEQRYINSFIDYKYYKKKKQRIQKLFLDPGNKISIYDMITENGYLYVEDSVNYNVKIIVKDFSGNSTSVDMNLVGKMTKPTKKVSPKTYFSYKDENTFYNDEVKITIPKGALYKNTFFNYSKQDNTYSIGDNTIPLHKSYSLQIKLDSLDKSKEDKYLIALVDGKSHYSMGGNYKDGFIKTNLRTFGKFKIVMDTIAPKIKPVNIKEGKWMTKESHIKIKITDEFSGIKSYNGYIDGNWVLMSYDYKKQMLKYNFSDIKLIGKKHTFKLVLIDKSNNKSVFETTFNRS